MYCKHLMTTTFLFLCTGSIALFKTLYDLVHTDLWTMDSTAIFGNIYPINGTKKHYTSS